MNPFVNIMDLLFPPCHLNKHMHKISPFTYTREEKVNWTAVNILSHGFISLLKYITSYIYQYQAL